MKSLIKYILLLVLGYLYISIVKNSSGQLDNYQGFFSLNNYHYIFTTEGSFDAIKNTLWMGILTVLVCGLIGTFLAFFVHFFDFPFKRFLDKILLLPLVCARNYYCICLCSVIRGKWNGDKNNPKPFWAFRGSLSVYGLPGILMVHAYTRTYTFI